MVRPSCDMWRTGSSHNLVTTVLAVTRTKIEPRNLQDGRQGFKELVTTCSAALNRLARPVATLPCP